MDVMKLKPYILLVILQSIYAFVTILSKSAFNGGLNPLLFVFYRQLIATILLAPLATYQWKRGPPLSLRVGVKIFIFALSGITMFFDLYCMGTKYTSAAVASAATNSVPVITFCIAVVLRIEHVKLRSRSGVAKVFGVVLCVAGVFVIAFYEGPHLKPLNPHPRFLHTSNDNHASSDSNETWIMGSFLMIISTTFWSIGIILQGFILSDYPSKLLFTFLGCFFSAIQTFLAGVLYERNFSNWKLQLNDGLLAVAFAGIFGAGVGLFLQAWCIDKKGPVFFAVSTPLSFIITIPCSSLLLGETIKLGSALGGILMVGGLYSVLWGKSKEMIKNEQDGGVDHTLEQDGEGGS